MWKEEAVCLLFNRWFTSGILNKSTVSESRKVPCDDLCEESESIRSNLTMFRLCWVWKYYEWFSEVLWLPRKSIIVWFTESVDRQISGMCGWARVTRILCAKHKNISWVFSLGDFLLENLLCAQRLWILNLFSRNRELYRLLPAIMLTLFSFS